MAIARGDIDRFITLISALGTAQPIAGGEAEIGEIIYRAASDVIKGSGGAPIDLRVPRIGSQWARRMIEDWLELTPRLFLPLGMPNYHRAVLNGVSRAVNDSGHGHTRVFIGGITSLREAECFKAIAQEVGDLRVGAMIQNPVALHACASVAQGCPVWIDIGEIIRNACGLPVEALDARTAMRDYVAEGRLPTDPLASLLPLVADLIEPLRTIAASGAQVDIGIDCTGAGESSLLVQLYALGFRKFSVPLSRHNEVRLQLGQMAAE